jgi:hypothetical protein
MNNRLLYIAAAVGLTRRREARDGLPTARQRAVRVVFILVVAAVVLRVGFAVLVRLGGVAWLAAALLAIAGVTALMRRWRRT